MKVHTISNPNRSTLDAYNNTVDLYINNTPKEYRENHRPLLRWIDAALAATRQPGNILEIGSGTGREARYMRSKGFDVTFSDGATAFIDHLKNLGESPILLNVLTDELQGHYDMIFANAVIPHFTASDLELTVRKMHGALNDRGLLAISAKQGNGEEWVDEKIGIKRYIKYWQTDELVAILEALGYKIIFLESGIPGDIPTHTWINLTAQKIS